MNRRSFFQKATILSGGIFSYSETLSERFHEVFPVVRVPPNQRKFKSNFIEEAIKEFQLRVKDKKLTWLFGNCFPNTLDTTVKYQTINGDPDTYVITGDIDAMWLRDSSAQVWPYLQFLDRDKYLKQLIAGVINRQSICILRDSYANAFYLDPQKTGEWKNDFTEMKPGLHERKWEIDSLCYPIRLAYHYWKITKDTSPFNTRWQEVIKITLKTFKEQQRKYGKGPYHFQRTTSWATDGVPMNGYGYPIKPVGLICSAFRPSDDATIFSFLIPSNFFAVKSLRQAAEMIRTISADASTSFELETLAMEVENALKLHAVVNHQKYGKVYAYEINGLGSYNLMDDANVPSLLSLPYLGALSPNDEVYKNTRAMLLSDDNPFYFKGKAGEGIGGPHVGSDMIWPISIIMRGLTSNDDKEIINCINTLKNCDANTGFMHESFHKDDSANFTRKWFAWANTLFGEFLWKTYKNKPYLLD